MKACTQCKEIKDDKEFSFRKITGKLIAECKICVSKRSREHYYKHKEDKNEKRKQYYNDNKGRELERCKKYYAENRTRIRARANEQNRIPERREKANIRGRLWAKNNPEKHSNNAQKHRKANPQKYDARQRIFWAIKLGFVVPPKICEICKLEKKIEAHHEDYTKPLEVKWLCKCCHYEQHTKERKCLRSHQEIQQFHLSEEKLEDLQLPQAARH